VESGQRRNRSRDTDRLDQLARAFHGPAISGEILGQPYLSLAVPGGQHQRGIQCQQRRRRVPDRRSGTQVAAQGGAVADQPGRERREQLGQQRYPTGQGPFDFRQAQRGTDVDRPVAERQFPQLVQPVDADAQCRPGVPDVEFNAPVGRSGDQAGIRILGQQVQDFGEAARADERALIAGDRGHPGGRCRPAEAAQERITVRRPAQSVGGIADRPITRAAAKVPAERVQVETVGPVFVVRRVTGSGRTGVVGKDGALLLAARAGFGLGCPFAAPGGRRPPVGAVVLRSHRADESRGAVPALGSAAVSHLPLNRMQPAGPADAFGGDDFLIVQGGCRNQAGVDRGPPDTHMAVGFGHHHCAGPALAFGAALLAAGESGAA